jgi:hypothetical protein
MMPATTWWRQGGGQAVSFGSDAHDPFTIGREFAAAAPSPRPRGSARIAASTACGSAADALRPQRLDPSHRRYQLISLSVAV